MQAKLHTRTCRKIYVMIRLLIAIWLLWLAKYITDYQQNIYKKSYIQIPLKDHIIQNKTYPFYAVICRGKDNATTTVQINQARTLLKSAAALTRGNLMFTLFSDSESLYNDVISPMKYWPEKYQKRLQVDFQPVRYPSTDREFRESFKTCSTFRILLPELMQEIDAAVYIDLDIIFLHPPEVIWQGFDRFNASHTAAFSRNTVGMARDLQRRLHTSGRPIINAGVTLMNFTRLRSAPGGGFTNILKDLYKNYKNKLVYGDQDIINKYFDQRPDQLYVMGCEWNFRWFFCMESWPDRCPESEKNGASLVHGAGKHFEHKHIFKFLYSAWEEYDIGSPIQVLIKKIEENIASYKHKVPNFMCGHKSAVNIFTKKLV